MMKSLILFPPQWSPLSPHLAVASIVSSIRDKGYTCHVRDFNIEFYNHILSRDYLQNLLVKLFNDEIRLQEQISKYFEPQKSPADYTSEQQIMIKNLLKIKEIREHHGQETKSILNLIDNAVEILKNKKEFYNFDLVTKSMAIIDKALHLVSLSDYPQEFSLHNFSMYSLKFCYEDILKYCNKDNMFRVFYDANLKIIKELNYDFIGISIGSSTQLLAGLTLAKLVKENTNAKICIGGNYISRIVEALQTNPQFFNDFADYVLYEEGENSVLELIENLKNKRKIADVSSLIFLNKQTNKVVVNEKKPPANLSDLPFLDLEGLPLNKYLMSEIVMPIQASRGCYWKKCTFCDHDFGQTYNVKDISHLIEEIKHLKQRFGISHFEFVDEAINPNYLENFSKRLIEENLEINWYCNLRIESNLTYDIFKTAHDAGLRMVLWGFESGSKRIMELINKGVDIEKRLDILKAASDAGIFNFAYIFFGFPTETKEEALETVDIICKNTNIIHAYGKSIFTLGKHAIINSEPEKFSIQKLPDEEEFSSNASYTILKGLNQNEINDLNEDFMKKSQDSYQSPAWMYIRYRETLFLYICKYGTDYIKNLQIKTTQAI